jgi:pyridoxine 5-phosphate synthase
MPVRLHINVDHVATVRNARGTSYPDPVLAASLCEAAGADGITAHLREDRRHIRDEDVTRLRASVRTMLNLEMAATEEMLAIAERTRPDVVTLVPERREERTTEGGLDVGAAVGRGAGDRACGPARGLSREPVRRAGRRGGGALEAGGRDADRAAHGGVLPRGRTPAGIRSGDVTSSRACAPATERGVALGLDVAAGHGLHRHNIGPVLAIPGIDEVNVGHAVIADAVLFGLDWAVRGLRDAMDRGIAERGSRP